MRIALIQTNPHSGKKYENLQKIKEMLEKASSQGANLAVLPEFCTTGYFKAMDPSLVEEIPGGYTIQLLKSEAKKHSLIIIGSIPEKCNKKLFDTAFVIGPRGYMGKYRKTHLWHEEKKWFSEGDIGFPIFKFSFGNIGLMLCWESRIPEVSRILAIKGANLICHPANFTEEINLICNRTRCIENSVFLACANRIGEEKYMNFLGYSHVIDNRGCILTKGGNSKEEILITDIDLEQARKGRLITELTDIFKTRRIDLYDKLLGYKSDIEKAR